MGGCPLTPIGWSLSYQSAWLRKPGHSSFNQYGYVTAQCFTMAQYQGRVRVLYTIVYTVKQLGIRLSDRFVVFTLLNEVGVGASINTLTRASVVQFYLPQAVSRVLIMSSMNLSTAPTGAGAAAEIYFYYLTHMENFAMFI